MAKHDSEPSGPATAFPMPDFGKLMTGGAPMLDSFAQSGNAVLKSVGELNAQVFEFAKQRLEAGVAAGQSLAQCKSMQAAIEMQMEFARSEMQAYLDEARKLLELAGQAAAQGFNTLQGAQKGE
jgi:hypothetical protein